MTLKDDIVEPPLPADADGWSFWRTSECVGFDITKRGLLISKDMMSLRGLGACERWMAERGWACLPNRIRIVSPEACAVWG